MPVTDERRQFPIVGETLQLRVRIVFDQLCIARVEVFASPQIAQQMRSEAAERIIAVVEPRAGLVDRYAQFLEIGAPALQLEKLGVSIDETCSRLDNRN